MNALLPSKIQPAHRERLACVYVRQSTALQVRQHHESTERQYHLQERAVTLGWPATAVEVIDEDQGRSGQSALHRTGFQRLVSQVSLGQVGIVLMLEASRLARNNSDWYHLIEICGVRRTLIADEQAVYDPREPNDRLLLGVKGTLSEAETFTLRTRLYEGRWNKARKGLLRFPLPIGYVRGADDTWELDPNLQVRERLSYVFAAFRRHGAARAGAQELREQQLDLPAYVVGKENYGALVWKTPTVSAVMRILTNPGYAGAYVYGRWDYAGERQSAKTGKTLYQLPKKVCAKGLNVAVNGRYGKNSLSQRPHRCAVGGVGAFDPAGQAGWTAAHRRNPRGPQWPELLAAHRLRLALPSPRPATVGHGP